MNVNIESSGGKTDVTTSKLTNEARLEWNTTEFGGDSTLSIGRCVIIYSVLTRPHNIDRLPETNRFAKVVAKIRADEPWETPSLACLRPSNPELFYHKDGSVSPTESLSKCALPIFRMLA